MKILNVNMSLDPVTGGGTAERTVQICRAIVKAGHECIILTTDIGITKEQKDVLKEINIIYLPCINSRFYLPKFSHKAITKIVSNTDIIHIMGHWTFLNALIYFYARKQKKKYVVCPAGALPIFGRSRIIKKIFNLLIGKRIIQNANGHIAITLDEVKQFITYGIDADDVTIIPNGINTDDFKISRTEVFRDKYGLSNKSFILFVGRLNPIKGPDLLLQAFSNVKEIIKDYHLVFVGPDGGMLSELKEMSAQLNAGDRVHFLGYLGGESKSEAYYAADLLVIPSRQEAMSLVVLEAGAAGTPVLLTDQCGFNEVANIGGGKVVPATVEGLQDGLIGILSIPDNLKHMGEKLKCYVSENYTWEKVMYKYLSLYYRILGETH